MGLDKEKAKRNLSKLIEKFKKELESGCAQEYNEEATKISFIQPLLEDVLGWDVRNHDEVSPEEKVSKGRVDYGLKVDGITRVFIEAKPIKADLDRHIEQAVRYGYNKKSVPFVLLTDFEGIKLFDVTVKPDSRNLLKGLKIDLEWNQYLEQFDRLWLLSKDSVIKGELDKLLLVKPKDRLPVDKAILDDLKLWRVSLTKDIFKNNPKLFHSDDREKDANFLKEITQRILDRIIFMRSCEDRGLTYRRPLKEIFEERTETVGTNTMIFLKEEFKHYNIIFDSDLFRPKEWETNLAVDFKVMRDIIFETYNPYQFDVIPLEVLGNIYEQYLGYTVRLTDHQVRYELKPEVRKAGGVYYTPEYIVDYIVKNTVGKLLQELSTKKIKKLRILDPACGSGSFLIRAYEEMLNYYRGQKKSKRKSKEKMGKLELEYEEAEPRLTIEEKSEILRKHIFGVDIDGQAVEVTKLSLMMKMLEGEYGLIPGRSIIPILDRNIQCGNSLISGEVLELKKYFGDKWYEVKPFNWEEEFEKIMVDEGGFDVVIGNPPYVRSGILDKTQRKYFSKKFKSATKQYDIYVLFIERGINLLKHKGYFGFIVSNKFFMSDYGKGVRNRIVEEMRIEEVIDVSYLPVFKGISIYPVIFIQRKERFTPNKIKVSKQIISEDSIKDNNIPFETVDAKEVMSNVDKRFDFSIVVHHRKIIKKIEKNKEILINLCKISRGFRPPPSKLIIKQKDKERAIKSFEKFIVGKDLIGPYSINWSGNLVKYIPNEIFESKPIEIFKGPKILIRDISLSFNAYLDYEGFLCLKTIYFLYDFVNINPKYLISILNSNIMNYYFKMRFSIMHIGGGYLRFRKQYLNRLPIRIVDFNNPTDKKLHDKQVALVDIMLDLNKKIQKAKGREKEQIQRQIDKTDREIDDLVYRLYGITEEERKIIEGAG